MDEVLSCVFAPPFPVQPSEIMNGSSKPALRSAISDLHVRNSQNPIKFPNQREVFPGTFLADVPPVVVDANWLRNDITYACRNDQRPTLLMLPTKVWFGCSAANTSSTKLLNMHQNGLSALKCLRGPFFAVDWWSICLSSASSKTTRYR